MVELVQGEKEHCDWFPERSKLATPETSGRLSTSVQRFDFWDRLSNQREL